MVGEEFVYAVPSALEGPVKFVLYIIGTAGIFIILYIIFGIINFILNRKKKKEIEKINQSLNEIKTLLQGKKVR
jgi:biopolymer transport protein ExbB/TolQ